MTIFEALRQSHEIQRELSQQLVETSGASAERSELFARLKHELWVHSVAEERHFYIPLMGDDNGVDLSRHAIAEHHEMDEMVEALEDTDPSSSSWLPRARTLADKVHHHLEEEEHKFFQMAGKLLSDGQKDSLADEYLDAYAAMKAERA